MADTSELKLFLSDLKSLKGKIANEKSKTGQIHKSALLLAVETLSKKWFDSLKTNFISVGFSDEDLKKYDAGFEHLLKVSSSKGNLKAGFLKDLKMLTASFNDDLILKLQTGKCLTNPLGNTYDGLLQSISNQDQNIYLKEAVNCAKQGFLRAAIVLGWCAGIDQIQRKVEQIGFVDFNIMSAKMASSQTGRFKRYNKIFKVTSLDDLKEVFDNDILWIIEGLGLVDLNQHTRLKSCFDMRNHCAHPGEAPITAYNVMSFFSDINEIILKNPNFLLRQ